MGNPTILHMADVHIGANRHTRNNPVTGESTAEESLLNCFNHAIDQALEHDVDAVVVAGDLYDSGRPTAQAMQYATAGFKRLIDAGIPVIAEDGNHGRHFVKAGNVGPAELLRHIGVHVYDKVGIHTLETKRGAVSFLGVPWPERAKLALEAGADTLDPAQLDDILASFLASKIEDTVEKAEVAERLVIASHVTLVGVPLVRGAETVINTRGIFDEIMLATTLYESLGISYGALGHIHGHQNLTDLLTYAGSLDRLTFGEAEEAKGAVLVELTEDKPKRTFLETPARHLVNIRLDQNTTDLPEIKEGSLVKVHLPVGERVLDPEVKNHVVTAGGVIVKTKITPEKPMVQEKITIKEGLSVTDAVTQWAEHQKLSDSMTAKVLAKVAGYKGDLKR